MGNPESQKTPFATPTQIASIYANGFRLGLTHADVFIVLQHNNRDLVQISLSYTTAKTLAQKLSDAIKLLEKESNNTIMSTEDISAFLKKELQSEIAENE